MKPMLEMMAAYNRWANEKVYESCGMLSGGELNRPLGAFFPTVIATLNHLLAADRIWMRRFTGEGEAPTRLDTILHDNLADLKAARQAEDQRIAAFIGLLDGAQIEGNFTYTPVTTPDPVTQRLGPALVHLFNHQTHHRGQLHMMLTVLGRPSLSLDLIYFQRTEEGRRFT